MKKFGFTLILLFLFSLSQSVFAADWRPVEGAKDVFWNADGLELVKNDQGIVDGDLVLVAIKRPMNPANLEKMIEAQTTEEAKTGFKKITHEVVTYCFSLKYGIVSYFGSVFLSSDEQVIADRSVISQFIKVPEKGDGKDVIVQVYQYLLTEQKAGKIK